MNSWQLQLEKDPQIPWWRIAIHLMKGQHKVLVEGNLEGGRTDSERGRRGCLFQRARLAQVSASESALLLVA
jgi:hypothetical protein